MSPDEHDVTLPSNSPSEEPPRSLFSRLGGIWFSPGETFSEIGRSPRVLVPLLILMVLGSLSVFLLVNRIGVQGLLGQGIDQAVASGRVTQQQADQQIEIFQRFATVIKIVITVFGAAQGPLTALIVAAVFKLISTLVGAENRFKQLFSVTVYTMLAVSLVSSILLVAVIHLKDPSELDLQNLISSNLAAIISSIAGKDSLPKFLMALARWVDLFAIWMLVLLSLGYAKVSERLKVSTAAISLCSLYVLIAIAAAAIAALRG